MQRLALTFRLSLMVTLLCLVGTSCDLPGHSPNKWSSHSSGTSTTRNGQRVAYTLIRLEHNDQPYVLIGLNVGGKSQLVGGGGGAKGTVDQEGNLVEWRVDTTDARTGTVTIAEDSLELADGGLFLVDVQPDKIEVQQLDVALEGLQETTGSKMFSEKARMVPEIEQFMAPLNQPEQ